MTEDIITEPDQAPAKDNFSQRIMLVMNRVIAMAQSRKMGPLWISLVVISSIAWTAWNVKNFQTFTQLNNSGIQQQLKLDSEIQQLSTRWENVHSETIDENLGKAELQVFTNYKALAEWLYQLTTQSKTNGLTLKYKLGVETQAPSLPDIISIPIEIEAAAYNKTNIYEMYQQLLHFMKLLISEPWHQELQQAGIENESSNKAKLSLVMNVWMWKPKSNSQQKSSSSDPLMDTMTPPMDMP